MNEQEITTNGANVDNEKFYVWLSAFDKIANPVYIIDAESYELLYTNEKTTESVGNVLGQPCYKALCGLDEVCEKCTALDKLDSSGKHSISEEHYNKITGQYYFVSECLIDWIDGRKARMSMAVPSTELHGLRKKHDSTAPLSSIHEAIISSTNKIFYAVDKDCNILYINEYANNISKYNLQIGQKLPLEKIYKEKDAEKIRNTLLPAVFQGKTFDGEVILIVSGGTELPVRYSAFPVRNDNGDIFAYATIAEDISDEKKNQALMKKHLRSQEFLANFSKPFTKPNQFDDVINEALRELEEFFCTDRIYFYDMRESDIILTHENVDSNDIESKIGLTFPFDCVQNIMDELEEKQYLIYNDVRKHYDRYPYLDYGAVSSMYIDLIIDGNRMGFINLLAVKEQAKWEDEDGKLAVTAGSILAGAIALHKSEVTLKKAVAETQKANLAKSQFLSNVSHEIRTPLNAIMGMAQVIKNSLVENNPETTKPIDEILVASDHLLSLLNDVLDMSKIEANKIEIANEPFNLYDTIQEVVGLIIYKASDKGITFNTNYTSVADINILGDSMRLKQVILNLLSNAIKFTHNGGEVNFNVSIEYNEEDTVCINFIVQDNGIGMSESQIEKLFKPFQQGSMDITGQYGGTGLGLAISHNLIDKMGGEISVVSQLDVGSAFEFNLTFMKTSLEAENKEIVSPIYNDYSGKHVLVVEDIDINRMMIIQLLEGTNIKFEEAVNGQEAVDLFATSPVGYYDCILMDIQMPVMNGIDATKHIRGLNRNDAKKVPIVAVTANAYNDDVRMSFKAGMNAHISKPIDINRLLKCFEIIFE